MLHPNGRINRGICRKCRCRRVSMLAVDLELVPNAASHRKNLPLQIVVGTLVEAVRALDAQLRREREGRRRIAELTGDELSTLLFPGCCATGVVAHGVVPRPARAVRRSARRGSDGLEGTARYALADLRSWSVPTLDAGAVSVRLCGTVPAVRANRLLVL